jgi:hypothetical protein
MTADVLPYRSKTERKVIDLEERRAWKAARYLGQKARFGGEYDPMVAYHAGTQLVALADRRLRQLNGGTDDAA